MIARRRIDVRRADEQAGRTAEAVAALLLRLKGYRILERRFRGVRGEVDLIARRGGLLVFVEVKRRGTLDEAALSVTVRQRERIGAAAEEYLARHTTLGTLGVRFDAVLVATGRLPRHVPDAWRP
ncbi:MAG TPA: YraN family protein [Alphaproteobacteria bacterium]|jgi:putative endonuclease|nr:YraN family protein [Alphaproteobacteria bacterium]